MQEENNLLRMTGERLHKRKVQEADSQEGALPDVFCLSDNRDELHEKESVFFVLIQSLVHNEIQTCALCIQAMSIKEHQSEKEK